MSGNDALPAQAPSVPGETVSLPVAYRSHPTGEEVTDAWIAGFLHAIGRKPWDDMHDYAAVAGMEYARARAAIAKATSAGSVGTQPQSGEVTNKKGLPQ